MIQRTATSCLVFAGILLVATPAFAKGRMIGIEIIGDGISTPLRITDEKILRTFNIWNGPSVRTFTKGVENPPPYLDTGIKDGRFVAWPRGSAVDKPDDLQRFEVYFEIEAEPESRYYVFAYEMDPESNEGFIFLPEWNNNLISHGWEGSWLYATERWNDIIWPEITAHKLSLGQAEQGTFECIAGNASLKEDGTIVLLRDGGRDLHYEYPPPSDQYRHVWDHIGGLEQGEEKVVSCWPLRVDPTGN
jgi:hypothetical protein